jgi:lipopolysaccharide transport system permease protein
MDAFRDAAKSLWTELGQAWHLAWRLFVRDTRADHRQSLLGYVWLVVPALANTLTWVFLNSQNVIRVDSGPVAYPLFVLTGTILWTAFNGALMSMLNVIGPAKGILSKVNFPHEALVYTGMLKSLTDAALAAILLIPALVLFHVGFSPVMFLFLIALGASLILGWAIGLTVLPIAALYGDIGRAVQLLLRFGLFLAPVIFPLPQGGAARQLMLLNPATAIIVSGRGWLTGSGESMVAQFVFVLAGSLALYWLALLFYKVALPHLIERLSG